MYGSDTILSVIGDLVTQRTSIGDSITLVVKYNGNEKPSVKLLFNTFDKYKKQLGEEADLTNWLPTSPSFEEEYSNGVKTGRIIGFSDWRDFIHSKGGGLGAVVESIVISGGRRFSFEEKA